MNAIILSSSCILVIQTFTFFHYVSALKEKIVTRKEFEGLQSELQKLSAMGTFTVVDEETVGQNVLENSTLNTLDHILAKLPSSFTMSLKLQGTYRHNVILPLMMYFALLFQLPIHTTSRCH